MRSGDKGYFDEGGWMYFVDRKSNMIKRAGENISASEVEEVLNTFPGLARWRSSALMTRFATRP